MGTKFINIHTRKIGHNNNNHVATKSQQTNWKMRNGY